MRKTKKDKRLFLDYIIVFYILYWFGSFSVMHKIIPSLIVIFLGIVLCAIVLYIRRDDTCLTLRRLVPPVFASTIIVLSSLINGQNLFNEFKVIFYLFTALFMTSSISIGRFKYIFSNLMVFIIIGSLVFFSMYLIFPKLNTVNVVVDLDGNTSSNLYIFNKFTDHNRNCAFFWEPGTFQTFIILAMLFDFSSNRLSIIRLFIYTLGIFSTLSTTGFIALIMFYLLLLFLTKRISRKKKAIFLLILLLGALFVYLNQDLFFSSRTTSTTFGKLIAFFENSETGNQAFTSASVRIYAILKPIELFFKKPFFGYGYDDLAIATKYYTGGMNTNTPVNWFAVYGVFFGLFMVLGYIGVIKSLRLNKFVSFFVLLIVFVSISSENYVRNSLFIALAIFGYDYLLSPKKNKPLIKLTKLPFINSSLSYY